MCHFIFRKNNQWSYFSFLKKEDINYNLRQNLKASVSQIYEGCEDMNLTSYLNAWSEGGLGQPWGSREMGDRQYLRICRVCVWGALSGASRRAFGMGVTWEMPRDRPAVSLPPLDLFPAALSRGFSGVHLGRLHSALSMWLSLARHALGPEERKQDRILCIPCHLQLAN